MKAKEYWERIRDLNLSIERRIDDIQHLYELATKVTAGYREDGGNGGGGVSDKIGDAATAIVALQIQLAKEIEELTKRRKHAYMMLSKISKERYRTVLHRRYLLDEGFDEIAKKMGYSRRNIDYLHGDALAEFQKILDSMKHD